MSSVVDRERFRQFAARRYKTVQVPGLGDVRLQSLSEGERASIEAGSNNGNLKHLRAKLIAACVVNEDGKRIWADSEEHLDEILSLDCAVTVPLAAAIDDLFSTAGIEELAKN